MKQIHEHMCESEFLTLRLLNSERGKKLNLKLEVGI